MNTPPNDPIQIKFEQFHADNPWVYRRLEQMTHDLIQRGRTRVGIGMLFEVIRWQVARSTTDIDFKLNNNYRSRYARLLIERHPEWDDIFETRALRSENNGRVAVPPPWQPDPIEPLPDSDEWTPATLFG